MKLSLVFLLLAGCSWAAPVATPTSEAMETPTEAGDEASAPDAGDEATAPSPVPTATDAMTVDDAADENSTVDAGTACGPDAWVGGRPGTCLDAAPDQEQPEAAPPPEDAGQDAPASSGWGCAMYAPTSTCGINWCPSGYWFASCMSLTADADIPGPSSTWPDCFKLGMGSGAYPGCSPEYCPGDCFQPQTYWCCAMQH